MKRLIKTISVLITTATLISGCSSNRNSEYFVSVAPGGDIYGVQNGTSTLIETGPEIEFTIPEATAFNDFYNPLDTSYTEDTNTTVNPESEYPKDYGITKCTAFSEGIAFIETEGGRKYAIDADGNIVFEFDSAFDQNDLPTEGFCNGYLVYDCVGYSFKNGNHAHYIINNKGDVLMDAGGDDADFDGIIILKQADCPTNEYIKNGYCLAFKFEKKFSGDVFSLGVIKDGDWLIPLRNDYKMSEVFSEKPPEVLGNNFLLNYLGDTVIYYDGYCYDFVNDEIIAEDIYDPLLYKNGIIITSEYVYDTKTKTKNELGGRNAFTISNALICKEYPSNDYCEIIYDYEGNKIINTQDYGFTVSSPGAHLYKDGYIFLDANKDNDNYIIVFNENYELAFEPIFVEYCRSLHFENGIITIVDDLYSNTITQYNTEGKLINKVDGIKMLTHFSSNENLFYMDDASYTFPKYVYINMDGEIVIQ